MYKFAGKKVFIEYVLQNGLYDDFKKFCTTANYKKPPRSQNRAAYNFLVKIGKAKFVKQLSQAKVGTLKYEELVNIVKTEW